MNQIISFVTNTGSGPVNTPVSAENPLPTTGSGGGGGGDATAANQVTQITEAQAGNALLTTIEGDLDTVNSTLSTISTRVNTPPSVQTTAMGLSKFRATNLTNTAQAVKASAGNLFGIRVQSPAANVLPTYIKFFNTASGSVTPGTTVPVAVFEVPAFDDPNTGQLLIVPGAYPLENFGTAISVLTTSVLADSGSQTAPTSNLLIEAHYA